MFYLGVFQLCLLVKWKNAFLFLICPNLEVFAGFFFLFENSSFQQSIYVARLPHVFLSLCNNLL